MKTKQATLPCVPPNGRPEATSSHGTTQRRVETAVFIHTVTNEEYSLIAADLMRARQFLRALRASSDVRNPRVIREALTLAAIVSYCRPFKMSRDADGCWRRWIPPELIKDLPEECKQAHGRFVQTRDRAWAHTDWEAHSPVSYDEPDGLPSVLSRNPWAPMGSCEIDALEFLLNEVDKRIQSVSMRSTRRGPD